jgi:hypothetical protein
VRFSTLTGLTDTHFGGVAISNASQGYLYQLWTATILNGDIWLSAPNTPIFKYLSGTNATWVGLAFDQSANIFLAYTDINGNAKYYWFDSTIPGYRTSTLSGVVHRVFAALDDSRLVESSNNDVIFAYTRSGTLYFRAQRDRFGTEYNLGAAPATLVQVGMSHVLRFQFAFQNVQGSNTVPPVEYAAPVSAGQPL